MIQTRNQYLQFMLVMLAAWGISWGARFVMEQAVLLYGSGKNYLFTYRKLKNQTIPLSTPYAT
ncbi:hypothetical protein OkiPb00117_34710 [Escherichia coli]|uniref:hypothetical protein n=1 Tax=Escherichia coli TaxID=562 RepID=UPI00102DC462|nr:hypothetical protein [Escherichia coli]EHR8786172.1 hypothetical protein [Escherichia coli]EJT7737625.1 hypothetical protein [Escherichia coli]MDZ9271242.1 hypothetical protein [Escherichia coli]RZY61212.1 hypothetical protein EXX35_23580 [Escherichia coli]